MINLKKLSIVIFGIVLSSVAQATEDDKVLHFAASSAIGFAASGYFEVHEQALAACVSVGLAKEIYDELDYGGFSGKDLVADVLGCGLGVVGAEYLDFRLGFERHKDIHMITFNMDF